MKACREACTDPRPENSPPIAEVVAKGALPILVRTMDCPDENVQFEAAWALTNVASGPNREVLSMLKFVRLCLSS